MKNFNIQINVEGIVEFKGWVSHDNAALALGAAIKNLNPEKQAKISRILVQESHKE